MDAALARNIAQDSHLDRHDRFGERVIEHAARVAAAVPPEAQAIAWLHDVLENSPVSTSELRADGLTAIELAALELLTRFPAESYELYALRIAHASGPEGELARIVKLADLDDHLAHTRIPATAPPFRWARRHIAAAHARDERERGLDEAAS